MFVSNSSDCGPDAPIDLDLICAHHWLSDISVSSSLSAKCISASSMEATREKISAWKYDEVTLKTLCSRICCITPFVLNPLLEGQALH